MTTIDITIGWTRSDPGQGYWSFDGYRPGASQHEETITVDVPEAYTERMADLPYVLAEHVFDATNNPSPIGLSAKVAAAIDDTGYYGQGAHYSLSVGDTITVGEVRLACASLGWERVYEEAS